MALKEHISSPLEAGRSVLDAHRLPPPLAAALEFVSARLAAKALHLSLVVVRRDYQLPAVVPPHGSPGLPKPPTPTTPPGRRARNSVSALKQLVRAGSVRRRPSSTAPGALPPLLPGAPPPSPPPLTTPSTAPSAAADGQRPLTPGPFGVRLIHAPDLAPRARRVLASTLAKADREFGDGAPCLPPATSPAGCGLSGQLFASSIVQNEVLFASDGLTLVSLDRLYSLKSALSSYSRTPAPTRLEDAVDELRRLVLATNGVKASKADILRSYDWLSVSDAAILDLDRMYRRAYGGPDQAGAIAGVSTAMLEEPAVGSPDDDDFPDDSGPELPPDMIGIAVTTTEPCKPPSPRGPVLRLQTNVDSRSLIIEERPAGDHGDGLAARPADRLTIGFYRWSRSPIDRLMSAGAASPVRSSWGPRSLTPNNYGDISPITRSEWGFLMVGTAFQAGRTVAVETC